MKPTLSLNDVTYQLKHVTSFGVDAAKRPIRESLQPRPVTLEDRNTKETSAITVRSSCFLVFSS